MSGHIKNFQLFYDSKQASLPGRSKRPEATRSLLRDINLLKLFTKMGRTSTTWQKESRETKESQHRRAEEERFIVVSKCKNTAQVMPIQNLSKNFKLHRQRIRTFVSEISMNNQSSEKTIKCYPSKQLLKSAKSTQKIQTREIGSIDSVQKSQILITRKSIVCASIQKKQKMTPSPQKEQKNINNNHSTLPHSIKTIPTEKTTQKRQPLLASHQITGIKSQSFIVVEYPSERIIVSQRSTLPGQIASLTKIMTFYTIMHIAVAKNIDIKSSIITVSPNVSQITGTTAELAQGQQYTIEQLLYGLMLPSGNDAASELALWGGSLLTQTERQDRSMTAFVNEMNKQARVMGLKHTQFGNPHGLPSQCARSNAWDIAKLCCKCMKNALFRRVVSCQSYKAVVKGPRGTRMIKWENTNKLLRREGFVGLKTGITATAGPCLAAAYTFRSKTFISVVLRAPKVSSRFKETRHLLFWTMSQLFRDLSEEEYIQLRALKRENYQLDSDYSEEEEEFKYGNRSFAEHQRRCNILEDL